MLNRRNILLGLIVAPAVVRASSLMPVKSWLWEAPKPLSMTDIVTATLRARSGRLAEDMMRNNAFLGRLITSGAIYSKDPMFHVKQT